MATKINDASNFGALLSTGRQVVRDSNGYLWAVLIDDTNNDLELWRSTNGGTTWTEQDSSNSPFAANYDSDDACALAIDSEDTLHIVHAQYDFSPTAITTIKYYTFSSGSWSSEENIQSYADLIAGTQQIDIAIDSNDIPHVAYTMPSLTSGQIRYANRIGGSWSTVSVAGGSGYVHLGVSITLNNKDVPIIAYVQDLTVTDYVYGSLGNQNDATSWSHRAISSTSNATLGTDGVSVAIDSSGNAWVAYVDSDQSICIAVQSSNWTNAWTTSDSGTTGSEPSLVIDGTDKYVFYRDASGNIAYQKYDGSWSGETDLQTGTYQDVKARWASATQYDSGGVYSQTTVDSYSESNQSSLVGFHTGQWSGQSFTGKYGKLKSVKFYIDNNSATGSAYAKIYSHSGTFGTSSVPTGTALAVSDAVDISTISNTGEVVEFTFSDVNQIFLQQGTYYVATVESTDVSTTIAVGVDNTSPTHAGNHVLNSEGWSADNTKDTIFYVDVDIPQPVSSLRTYYFDASDAGPTDGSGVWTNDANAFDGDITTDATLGFESTGVLEGTGTNAPASGGTIVGVKARAYGTNVGGVSDLVAVFKYSGTTLGTSATIGNEGWTAYVDLSTPSGGWTWAKVQALEVEYTATTNSGTPIASKAEIIVQTSDSPVEIDYLFSDATDVYWDALSLGSTLQTDYFNVNFATGGTEEATHSPVTTSLTVVTPTTSYVQVESNTPNAVSTTLTVITPTVSYVQVESNTPNPVTTALTVVAPTTDYVSTYTRTPDPVSATLTVVSPTTSYVQVESDTPNAVSTALTVVAPTSSYVQVESNTPNAVTTALTVVAPTSDYSSVWSDTPNSVTTALSVVAPTTSYVQVGTDTPNAVATTLSVIAPIVTFADEDSPTPIVLQLAVQAPTVSYVQVESATHSPVTTALTVPAPTSDYSLTSTTTPDPVSATLSVVTPTTSYVQVESDTPNAVATSLSVVTPTSSYVQVESATHTALSTALTVVAPTSTAQYTGTPDPISTSLTVITPTSSYQEIATRSHNALSTTLSVITPISTYADEDSPTPVILQLTVATPSVSYVQVETDTPNPVSTTLSVATPTSSYVQVESDTPSAIATSLSVIAPTTSYVQVETATHLPVSTALSVVAPTSSYVQVESDTPNAVAITLSTVTPESGYSEGTTANPTPISLTITPIAPETSYVFVGSDTPDPVAITLSPVTPVSTFSDSDSPTPVVLQITPKTPSVSYIEVGSDTPDSIPTALSVITPTSSYLAVYSDTPDPVVITGTIPAVSSSYVEEYTGSTNPIVLTISNPQATWDHVVQSSYEATVDPILLTFSIPSISPYALVNVFETSPNEIFVKNKLKIKISGDLYT